MSPVALTLMTPAQEEGWQTLLDLYQDFPIGWCLIGGQMVWLLALEHGVEPMRLTEDVDVAVDVRANQGAIRDLCGWLESRRFKLEGINTDGIGHRYVSSTYSGPGKVKFDILAPDHIGQRADLTTSPPARTVSAPGTRNALDAARPSRSFSVSAVGMCCALRSQPRSSPKRLLRPSQAERTQTGIGAMRLSCSPSFQTLWTQQPSSPEDKGIYCAL